MQGDNVLPEYLPLLVPRIIPDQRLSRRRRLIRRSRKRARRIDLVPGGPMFARDPVHIGETQRMRPAISGEVGDTRLWLARVGAVACEPLPKLLQHSRVVVEDFKHAVLDEEWIHVRVGIETSTDKQIWVLAGELGNDAGGCLQVAPLV